MGFGKTAGSASSNSAHGRADEDKREIYLGHFGRKDSFIKNIKASANNGCLCLLMGCGGREYKRCGFLNCKFTDRSNQHRKFPLRKHVRRGNTFNYIYLTCLLRRSTSCISCRCRRGRDRSDLSLRPCGRCDPFRCRRTRRWSRLSRRPACAWCPPRSWA